MTKTKQLNVRLPVPLLERLEEKRMKLPMKTSRQEWIRYLLAKSIGMRGQDGR